MLNADRAKQGSRGVRSLYLGNQVSAVRMTVFLPLLSKSELVEYEGFRRNWPTWRKEGFGAERFLICTHSLSASFCDAMSSFIKALLPRELL